MACVVYQWVTKGGKLKSDVVWTAKEENLDLNGQDCKPDTICQLNYSEGNKNKVCQVKIVERFLTESSCALWQHENCIDGRLKKDYITSISKNSETSREVAAKEDGSNCSKGKAAETAVPKTPPGRTKKAKPINNEEVETSADEKEDDVNSPLRDVEKIKPKPTTTKKRKRPNSTTKKNGDNKENKQTKKKKVKEPEVYSPPCSQSPDLQANYARYLATRGMRVDLAKGRYKNVAPKKLVEKLRDSTLFPLGKFTTATSSTISSKSSSLATNSVCPSNLLISTQAHRSAFTSTDASCVSVSARQHPPPHHVLATPVATSASHVSTHLHAVSSVPAARPLKTTFQVKAAPSRQVAHPRQVSVPYQNAASLEVPASLQVGRPPQDTTLVQGTSPHGDDATHQLTDTDVNYKAASTEMCIAPVCAAADHSAHTHSQYDSFPSRDDSPLIETDVHSTVSYSDINSSSGIRTPLIGTNNISSEASPLVSKRTLPSFSQSSSRRPLSSPLRSPLLTTPEFYGHNQRSAFTPSHHFMHPSLNISAFNSSLSPDYNIPAERFSGEMRLMRMEATIQQLSQVTLELRNSMLKLETEFAQAIRFPQQGRPPIATGNQSYQQTDYTLTPPQQERPAVPPHIVIPNADKYAAKYDEATDRLSLAKSMLSILFEPEELLCKNISGANNYGVLDASKINFLFDVVFAKFPTTDLSTRSTIRQNINTALSTFLRRRRHNAKPK